jgi:hypothetical protein
MNTTKKIKKGGNNKNKTKKWVKRFREVLKGFKASEDDEWSFLPNQKGTLTKSDDIPVSQAPESDDIPALSTNLKQAPKPFRNKNVKIPQKPFGNVKIPPQPYGPPPQAPLPHNNLDNQNKIYETDQSKQAKEELINKMYLKPSEIPANQTEIIKKDDKKNVENYCKMELGFLVRHVFFGDFYFENIGLNPDKTLNKIEKMLNEKSPHLSKKFKEIRDSFVFESNDTYDNFFTRVNNSIIGFDCKKVDFNNDDCLKMNKVIISLKINYLTYPEYKKYTNYPLLDDEENEVAENNPVTEEQTLKNGQQLKNDNEQNSNSVNELSPVPKNPLKYNVSEYSFVISKKNNDGTVSIFVYKVKSNEINEILKRRQVFFKKYSVNKDKTGEIVQTLDTKHYEFSRDDYTLIHDVNNNVKSFDNKNNDVEYSYVISSKDDDYKTVSVFICNLSSDEIREITTDERDIFKDLKLTEYFVQRDKKTVTIQEDKNTVQTNNLRNNHTLSELFKEIKPPKGGKKRKTFKRKTKILKRKTFKKHKRHNRTTK